MSVTTPDYFLFLAAIFLAFWATRRWRLASIAVILFADYFFYAKWDLIYLAIIPLAATCDFFIGQALEDFEGPGARRALVTTSIVLNIGLIISSRYVPFLTSIAPTHRDWHFSWVLPLGLSFYAFQAMTYTIDIYRKLAKPTQSYLTYLAAVSFFPTTLAGPITPVHRLVAALDNVRVRLGSKDGGRALFLISMGLAKKFLIADYLAENLINRVFDLPKLYSGGEALLAAYAYTFQLYYDFSGYTDIVLGSALLLGIQLPVNFNKPYMSANVAEFWRRWHISLSNWLRDNLFFSLPGQRSKWRPYLNLVITMAIGGLWHGPNWTFLVWGLLHGFGLAVARGFEAYRGRRKPSPSPLFRTLRIVGTFHFVVFAWIFFRAGTLRGALDFLGQIGTFNMSFPNVTFAYLLVLAVGVAAHYVPASWYKRSVEVFSTAHPLVQGTAMALLVVAIRYVVGTGAAPFIYSKF